MGTKISRLLTRPFYVYLYGLAFMVFKVSAYISSFKLLPAANFIFLYCAVSYALFLFFRKLTNPAFAGIGVVILWASLLHVVGIAQLFGYLYSYIPIEFYLGFYSCVLILLIVFCLAIRRVSALTAPGFNQVANVFLLMASLVFLFNGIRKETEKKAEVRQHFHGRTKIDSTSLRKDIVWILMDEYGATESLHKQFSFKNPLDSVLRQEHFIVLDNMHSRFNNTLFSVNSIFNMDDSVMPSSYYEGIDLLRHGSLIPAIERSGYRFINLGFFDLAEHPMIADRSGYPYSFLQQLFSGTLFSMLYTDWKNSIVKCDVYNQRIIKKLNDTLSSPSVQPRFIWAHMTIPHTPFCRDASGNLKKDTALRADGSVYIKRGYIAYLQYGNSILLSILKQHPDLSDKIVIISGDHGPRFPFLKDKKYQTWPYVAVHIPGQYDSLALNRLKYISQLPEFLLKHISN